MCIRDRYQRRVHGEQLKTYIHIYAKPMRSQTLIVLLCLASLFAFSEAKKKHAQKTLLLEKEGAPNQPYVPTYGHVHKLVDSYHSKKATHSKNAGGPFGNVAWNAEERATANHQPGTVPYGNGGANGPSEARRRRPSRKGVIGTREGTVETLVRSYNKHHGKAHVIPGDHNFDASGIEAYRKVEAAANEYPRPCLLYTSPSPRDQA
eukprot:TRINITY_DN1129_c0_g1_i11.p2 TRINITY_DN1129_c0_g1~~TRINITY_DN1129_c0_g1_i11.p2  ORF type:complete len:206 (+),score=77.09 TRINITY_DN1129_c0_g1_i11:3-620(+)